MGLQLFKFQSSMCYFEGCIKKDFTVVFIAALHIHPRQRVTLVLA